MRIRTKLALSYLTTVTLLTALLTFVVISKTLENSIEQFVFHAQQKMKLVDSNYQIFIESVRRDVLYLSKSPLLERLPPAISNYMGDSQRATDATAVGGIEADVERFFDAYGADRPHLRDIYLGTVAGGFVGMSDEPLGSYDPRRRPWYIAAIDKPRIATLSDPYLSEPSEAMISVAIPVVKSDGSLLGVQSIDVTLEQLTELVQSVRLGETGYMMLMDEHGTILSDPSNSANLFRNVADIDDPLYQAFTNNTTASFEVGSNGSKKQVATYIAEPSGWQFAVVIDSSEIVGRQWPMIQSVLVIAVIMAVVFLVLGFYVAAKITSPLNHVTASLEHLAEGDADLTQDLEINSRDEIGELAMWFNRFLESARENRSEQLRAQKLEAIGQLAAGIAHELNTPSQYVSDNVSFLAESFKDLTPLLTSYQEMIDVIGENAANDPRLDRFKEILENADTEYVMSEIPVALEQSREGLDRVRKIVLAMKAFSHPGDEMKQADLNDAIRSTATVARNEWKFVADLELDLQHDLPTVNCVPSAINQVILNLIVNAAHAIGETQQGNDFEKGSIRIKTEAQDECVAITVSDSGCGMPEEVRQKIFDPFFTTKEVGKGTGQGLSMGYDVIVKNHNGSLTVESEPGVGTQFTIRLPCDANQADQAASA